MDVIAPLGEARLAGEQLGDLANFGRYMLCLVTSSVEAAHDPGRWLEVVKRRSGNLAGALGYLVNLEGISARNINEFLANIPEVMVSYADASLQYPSPSLFRPVNVPSRGRWMEFGLET